MKKSFRGLMFFSLLSLLALSACASKMQPPDTEMALATSAVERASSAGAYDYAPLDLAQAREKIDKAKQAIQAEKYTEARQLLQQAEVDARVAESKSTTAKHQAVVDDLKKSIEVMQEEIRRSREH